MKKKFTHSPLTTSNRSKKTESLQEGTSTNKQKISISVVMIGHNEAHHLAELLPTLSWAKEIIYVDCESSDASLTIARKNRCKIFRRPNNMNPNIINQSLKFTGTVATSFGIAENKDFAIKQATENWILLIDPDERMEDGLVAKIKDVVSGNEVGGYYLNRKNYYLGKFLRYGGNYPDWQLRLVQKKMVYFSHLNVHEHLDVSTKPKEQLRGGEIHHYTYESIFELLKKNNLYSSFEAESVSLPVKNINGVGTLIDFMLLKPLGNFLNRYIFKRGFLDGFEGLVFAFFNAFKFQLRYLKIREN